MGYTEPLGKKSNVFRIPKIARGTRGSSTRTISRNIIVLNATEVSRIISISPSMVPGWKIVPTPASSDPMAVMTIPVITALIAPAAFRPSTSSAFVIATGFIVYVEHATADHHGYEHRQRNRARQQILHVLNVGIHFDNLQHC